MAYQNGTALDLNDLLNKLRIFLSANGWTVNFWGDRTNPDAGGGKALTVTKSGVQGTFLAHFNDFGSSNLRDYLYVLTHGTYVSDPDPDVLPDSSGVNGYCNGMQGPFKQHWFFEGTTNGSTYCYVVVEVLNGIFKHFGIGKIETAQPVTNGLFAYWSFWNYHNVSPNYNSDPESSYHSYPFDDSGTNSVEGTSLRVDADATSPKFFKAGYWWSGSGTRLRVGFRQPSNTGSIRMFAESSPSDETGRAVLVPLECGIERPSEYFSHIGSPPDMRFVNVRYLEPAQELSIGLDTWVVFPAHRKLLVPGGQYSGNYGYAYRKVV